MAGLHREGAGESCPPITTLQRDKIVGWVAKETEEIWIFESFDNRVAPAPRHLRELRQSGGACPNFDNRVAPTWHLVAPTWHLLGTYLGDPYSASAARAVARVNAAANADTG